MYSGALHVPHQKAVLWGRDRRTDVVGVIGVLVPEVARPDRNKLSPVLFARVDCGNIVVAGHFAGGRGHWDRQPSSYV